MLLDEHVFVVMQCFLLEHQAVRGENRAESGEDIQPFSFSILLSCCYNFDAIERLE